MSFIRDPRHRYSVELRPDAGVDSCICMLADALESSGLVAAGSARAPRFQPHLTLLRAASAPTSAARAVADTLSVDGAAFELGDASTFASGRIVHVVPREVDVLQRVRADLVEQIPAHEIDPLATQRPWTPHVTITYEVVDGATSAAIALIDASSPMSGRWTTVEIWDLAVRPTRMVHVERIR